MNVVGDCLVWVNVFCLSGEISTCNEKAVAIFAFIEEQNKLETNRKKSDGNRKGDVQLILEKNIVSVVLACNNYELSVINGASEKLLQLLNTE
jgi:cobalamin-dependent methionine synthase I